MVCVVCSNHEVCVTGLGQEDGMGMGMGDGTRTEWDKKQQPSNQKQEPGSLGVRIGWDGMGWNQGIRRTQQRCYVPPLLPVYHDYFA